MEFTQCAKERRSIRTFKDQPIPHALIEEIVEVASYAPSWKNSQISRYIFVEDEAVMEQMASECVLGFAPNGALIRRATAVMVVTMVGGRSGFERDGSYSTPKGDRFEMFDAGLATQTFCLAAHDKGLATVILGYFDEEKLIPLLNIPEGQKVACVIGMGYPDESPKTPRRKTVEELLTIK